MMVTMRSDTGKDVILHSEELKTGHGDRPEAARTQLDNGVNTINAAAAGHTRIKLIEGGKDVTDEIDLASMRAASSKTRGPERKGFETSLGITTKDLDALISAMLDDALLPSGPSE